MVEDVIATMYNKLNKYTAKWQVYKTLSEEHYAILAKTHLLLDIHFSTSTLTTSLLIPILPTFLQLLFLF